MRKKKKKLYSRRRYEKLKQEKQGRV